MGILDELDLLCSQQGNTASSAQAGPSRRAQKTIDEERLAQDNQRATIHSLSAAATSTTSIPYSTRRFETETLSELQERVKTYGFRPSGRRSVLLRQLDQIHSALAAAAAITAEEQKDDGDQDISFSSSGMMSSSPSSSFFQQIGATPGRANAPVNLISDDEDKENEAEDDRIFGINQSQERLKRLHLSVNSSDDEHAVLRQNAHVNMVECDSASSEAEEEDAEQDEDDEEDSSSSSEESIGHSHVRISTQNDALRATTTTTASTGTAISTTEANASSFGNVPAAVARQLHDAVRADADVYARILLFEPVSFDEIQSLAKRAGVQGLRNKDMLRTWLDVQCICFYTAELTGQRQRY